MVEVDADDTAAVKFEANTVVARRGLHSLFKTRPSVRLSGFGRLTGARVDGNFTAPAYPVGLIAQGGWNAVEIQGRAPLKPFRDFANPAGRRRLVLLGHG